MSVYCERTAVRAISNWLRKSHVFARRRNFPMDLRQPVAVEAGTFTEINKLLPWHLASGRLCRIVSRHCDEQQGNICLTNFSIAYSLGQFAFFCEKNLDAYAAWAHTDDQIAAKLRMHSSQTIRPEHWYSGSNTVIIYAFGTFISREALITKLANEITKTAPSATVKLWSIEGALNAAAESE